MREWVMAGALFALSRLRAINQQESSIITWTRSHKSFAFESHSW